MTRLGPLTRLRNDLRATGWAGNRGLLPAASGLALLVICGTLWALHRGPDHDVADSAATSRTLGAQSTSSPGPLGGRPGEPNAGAAGQPPTGGLDGVTATPSAAPSSTGGGGLPKVSKLSSPPIAKFTCPAATVRVSTAAELSSALGSARPGDVIGLAAGLYRGEFTAARSGTRKQPVYLCGPRTAVLDAGAVKGGYTLHLDGASYWRVSGFTVQDGQKGVMLDGVTGVALQGLLVRQIGDEAVHLRRGSSLNVVRGLTIQQTGLRRGKFGEGVYIGTAQRNWCSVNKCQPDHSDGNFVIGNVFSATTAEAVDVKEGTIEGVVADNTFDGSGTTAADSWVDVKGNGWLIIDNRGTAAPLDGYQVHQILAGWGYRNLFAGNVSAVSGPGHAIKVTKTHDGNVVRCDNTVTGAGQGLSNIACQ